AFVLLTYLILHFSNHALGLYSLDAMEAGRRWFLMIWRSPLGTLALYGAIVVHGGLGLWLLYQRRTLRMPGWEAAQYALGLALPRTPGWSEALMRATHPPGAAEAAALGRIRSGFLDAYLVALGAVLAARGVRTLWQRRRSIRILYPAGRVVTVPVGFSVLEASRVAGIPHASVCGGRGRCSTCRVRVVRGLADLPPASEPEQRLLARVGAAPDVRLACQAPPVRDVAVVPLVAPSIAAADAFGSD